MSLLEIAVITVGCVILRQPLFPCVDTMLQSNIDVAGARSDTPQRTGEAVDVVLTAEAALAWDIKTGTILYEKKVDEKRPVASLSKLASALAVQSLLDPEAVVEIPPEARRAQRLGANIKLPVGQHATVKDLLAASLIPSANDAIVTLAVAAKGSEEEFVNYTNEYLKHIGIHNTKVANATGFSGGEQFSTTRDMQQILLRVYDDPLLRSFLARQKGSLTTVEGQTRAYTSTNRLLGTYVPILAAKTGYTREAGQNLAVVTAGQQQQEIGAVVLGSDQRFQDMKVLIEWIWRNYSW